MDTLETDQRLPHRHVSAAGGYVVVMVLRCEQWAIDNTAEQDTAEGYMTAAHQRVWQPFSQHISSCTTSRAGPLASVAPVDLQAPRMLLKVSVQIAQQHTLCVVCWCCCRCEPNEPCSPSALRKLGVLSWKLDADNHEADPRLAAIRKVRGYSYTVRAVLQQTHRLGALSVGGTFHSSSLRSSSCGGVYGGLHTGLHRTKPLGKARTEWCDLACKCRTRCGGSRESSAASAAACRTGLCLFDSLLRKSILHRHCPL